MVKKETDKKESDKITDNFERTPSGVRYESEAAGSSGARYYIITYKGEFSKKEIEKAKQYIKDNFDPVTITIENNIYEKNKKNK